ncbi:LANO_0H12134g1_1 [Lachancea nothofagi CBS 11611]|uniref:LANO_0H12134g1_1 n=1 Tax=Lachancea nothofagi CBS 11611 TaxID=1266666 RepID=A0A1G4KM91_9SACH|nr:LANO_0H12134g1_1 [Lachancea nothofagi CBS 11611]
MLPPINILLQEHENQHENQHGSLSEPCSPFFGPARLPSFKTNANGTIRLPPLQALQTAKAPAAIAVPRSMSSTIKIESQVLTTPRSSLKRARSCSGAIENSPTVTRQTNGCTASDAPMVVVESLATRKANSSRALTPTSLARTPATDHRKAFAFISHSQDTFPSKEPSIDNAPLARRKRRRTSRRELNILQSEFEMCPTPDKQKRLELSELCSMSEKAIQIWFQNKRQSAKRQHKVVNQHTTNIYAGSVETTPAPRPQTLVSHTMTPLAIKPTIYGQEDPDTPPSALFDTSNIVVDTMMSTSSPTPSKQSSLQQLSRGQALTFRLKNDTKTLTPIRTSPNNRVNKLINGNTKSPKALRTGNVSPTRQSKFTTKRYHDQDRAPLRGIDVNILGN